MKSLFEQLGGTYTRQGDYCLPDVCLPPEEERPIGIYGQRRRAYLKEHHRVLYYNLLTAGTLDGHLADIEEQAQELFLRLVEQYADTEGVTEALKADDPHGVGAKDERHPKPSERDRDAGNCIWVTSKRGSMTSACFACRKEQCCFETTLFRTLLTLFFCSGIMYL